MTADEFMPVAIQIAQDIITMLDNVEIFDGFSLLATFISLFALSIVLELIYYIQYGEWFPPEDVYSPPEHGPNHWRRQ